MQPTDIVIKKIKQELMQFVGASVVKVERYTDAIPGIVRAAAQLYTAEIDNVSVLLLFPENEVMIKPAHLILWQKRLVEISSHPVVVILDKVTRDFQTELIENKMSFITMSGSIYLPFLSLRITSKGQTSAALNQIRQTQLTRTATRFLTVLIYASGIVGNAKTNNSCFDKTGYIFTGGAELFNELGKTAGITTRRTMNRVLTDLEYAGIVASTGGNRNRVYSLAAIGMDLFYLTREFMQTPVLEAVRGDEQMIQAAFVYKNIDATTLVNLDGAAKSGVTALAQISEIEPDNNQDVFAFTPTLFKKIFDDNAKRTLKNFTIQRFMNPQFIKIERWADDPTRISKWLAAQDAWMYPKIPDPISLYLANNEKNDERVTGILEDLIEQVMGD